MSSVSKEKSHTCFIIQPKSTQKQSNEFISNDVTINDNDDYLGIFYSNKPFISTSKQGNIPIPHEIFMRNRFTMPNLTKSPHSTFEENPGLATGIDTHETSIGVMSSSSSAFLTKSMRFDLINESHFLSSSEKKSVYARSQILSISAPLCCSSLPDYESITHAGYILSRISFRTILMKKWKQCFWITYGQSSILFFRSHSDFDDWLTNPYLTKNQRNFLIKLKLDLVKDLDNDNVKGYQCTKIMLKAYRNQILNQFKLERLMYYGSTVAAAFASPEKKEAKLLHSVIIEINAHFSHNK